MSRIDEAWRRVAGAGSHAVGAARISRVDEELTLDDYPRETAVRPSTEVADRPPPLATTFGPVERRFALAGRDTKLVVGDKASTIAIEQYRRLAGSLHELRRERGLKTLMVTSALPSEGKTLTVANLALTLSESCRERVLLIDADLRRPSVHQLFRVPNSPGLSEVLQRREELPVYAVTEYLSVLPAGICDEPMAGLTSDRMRELIKDCAETFDWVLLDAAPIGMMPDAQILAHLTGAVLFVIEAQNTPYQLVTRALAEIDPDYVIGSILNGVADHAIPAAGYYRDYYATSGPVRIARR